MGPLEDLGNFEDPSRPEGENGHCGEQQREQRQRHNQHNLPLVAPPLQEPLRRLNAWPPAAAAKLTAINKTLDDGVVTRATLLVTFPTNGDNARYNQYSIGTYTGQGN